MHTHWSSALSGTCLRSVASVDPSPIFFYFIFFTARLIKSTWVHLCSGVEVELIFVQTRKWRFSAETLSDLNPCSFSRVNMFMYQI